MPHEDNSWSTWPRTKRPGLRRNGAPGTLIPRRGGCPPTAGEVPTQHRSRTSRVTSRHASAQPIRQTVPDTLQACPLGTGASSTRNWSLRVAGDRSAYCAAACWSWASSGGALGVPAAQPLIGPGSEPRFRAPRDFISVSCRIAPMSFVVGVGGDDARPELDVARWSRRGRARFQ
jgi:hypothetical protein